MLKFVLILLVVIGFATAHGPTRARMTSAAAPALEKMGPVGEWMLGPMHRFTADTEVKFIAEQLIFARTMGREVPVEGTFQQWIKRLQLRDAGNDPWGSPYYLKRTQSSFTVGSNGKDRLKNTADDIRATRSD